MNLYTKKDYRLILKTIIGERKNIDRTVNFQRMAEFVRIPKSYLSSVIHGKADLNADQLYLVCQYLSLSKPESAYLQLLLEYAKSGIKERKATLLSEIRTLQAEKLNTKEHLKSPAVSVSDDAITGYYLDPLLQLTHVCLSIPRYQKDQTLLAQDLKVSAGKLLTAINKLEQMSIISRTKDGIKLLRENMHLPKESPVYPAWRNQLKLFAINRLESAADEHAYAFSVVFSANEDTRKEIQSRFFTFLKSIEPLVIAADQEDAYQMSFELFPWTKW